MPNRFPSKFIKIIEPFWCHLINEFPGYDFFKKASNIELCPKVEPGSHSDASVPHSLKNIQVSDRVTKPQADSDVIKVRCSERPCDPGTKDPIIVASK